MPTDLLSSAGDLMPRADIDSVFEQLRQLFQQSYDEGAKDVFRRITEAAAPSPSRAAPQRRARGRKSPAPKGSARAFIIRVLSGRAEASVPHIIAAAKTPVESSVSTAAIRFELYKGKKERRYRNSKGKWSLAKPAAAKQ
jgi:hypothetical protein